MRENWVYRRGDVYLANCGAWRGSIQGSIRPVVVMQIPGTDIAPRSAW